MIDARENGGAVAPGTVFPPYVVLNELLGLQYVVEDLAYRRPCSPLPPAAAACRPTRGRVRRTPVQTTRGSSSPPLTCPPTRNRRAPTCGGDPLSTRHPTRPPRNQRGTSATVGPWLFSLLVRANSQWAVRTRTSFGRAQPTSSCARDILWPGAAVFCCGHAGTLSTYFGPAQPSFAAANYPNRAALCGSLWAGAGGGGSLTPLLNDLAPFFLLSRC